METNTAGQEPAPIIITSKPKKSRRREDSRAGKLRTILAELCPLNTPIESDKVRTPLLHLTYSDVEICTARKQLHIVANRVKGSTTWAWTRLPEGTTEAVEPNAPESLAPMMHDTLSALKGDLLNYARQLREVGADDETVVVALRNAAAVRLKIDDIAAESKQQEEK